jgi:lipopolysaccharide/colanic/teichoic acid biosynthesis glycosyltransferase
MADNKYQFKTSQKIYLPFKRLIAIFGSIVGIILCFALLWWWVIPVNCFFTKFHPFFVQERVGKHKKVFKMVKFRSMRLDANPNLAPSDMDASSQQSMETGFGKFLRKTSIDETPQLLNIFIGQMAFIGPRPGSAHNEEELIAARESYTPSAYDCRDFIEQSGYLSFNHVKIEIDECPFVIRGTEVPSISVTNEGLLQLAAEHIDEILQ